MCSRPGLGSVGEAVGDDDHVRLYGHRGIWTKLLFPFFSSDGRCPVAFDCQERTRPLALLPTTPAKLTSANPHTL